MKPSNYFQIYKEFFFALAAVFAISTLQGLDESTKLWPFAFMLIMVLVYSGKYGRVDLTMTNTLSRFFVERDENLALIDMVYTLLAQFVGGLLGSILFCLVTDSHTLILSPAPEADDRWRTLLCFVFFHGLYYQIVAAYKQTGDSTLERNLGMAFAYSTVAIAFQAFAPLAMGGINLDFCRQLGSKLIHSKESGDNLKETWWIFIFGPILGLLQAKLFVFVESLLECENAPAKTSSTANNDAGGDADDSKGVSTNANIEI